MRFLGTFIGYYNPRKLKIFRGICLHTSIEDKNDYVYNIISIHLYYLHINEFMISFKSYTLAINIYNLFLTFYSIFIHLKIVLGNLVKM